MAKTIQPQLAYHQNVILERLLLFSGVIASLYYVLINIIVGMQYEGYNFASQTVSEIAAIGAPTKSLWVTLMYFYTFLMLCFGTGIWMASAHNRPLRIAAFFLLFHAVVGVFWPPMHQREVLAAGGGTKTDTWHIIFTVITIILMLLIIISAAVGLNRKFRMYSIITIIVLLGMGLLTFKEAPGMESGLPTPLIGVWERISIGAYMIWVIVLAYSLLKKSRV